MCNVDPENDMLAYQRRARTRQGHIGKLQRAGASLHLALAAATAVASALTAATIAAAALAAAAVADTALAAAALAAAGPLPSTGAPPPTFGVRELVRAEILT